MKIFIWDHVEECTENYHTDGAVAIIAPSLKRAREIAFFDVGLARFKKPIKGIEIEPSHSYELKGFHEEKVLIFPNAGCC